MCNLLFFLRRMKNNLSLVFLFCFVLLCSFLKHFLEPPEPESKLLGLGRDLLSNIPEEWMYPPVSLETVM